MFQLVKASSPFFSNNYNKASSSSAQINRLSRLLGYECIKLQEKGFPQEYELLLRRISQSDIVSMLQWVIENPKCLKGLSPDHPIRLGAAKPGKSSEYPFPVTIHFVMDAVGNMQLIYDPNSKLARSNQATPIKDSEVEAGETPTKQRGKGAQKTVRDTWSFHTATGKLEPSVANVVKDEVALKYFYRGKLLYQADNPFLLPTLYGAEYWEHGKEGTGQRKAISFAPRAEGELFDFIKKTSDIKTDLADILWACYACIRSVASFHASGRLHRDIKGGNFLFRRTLRGIDVYLNDLDYSLTVEEARSMQSEAGSFLYLAFDRPFFNELLKLHKKALKEIAWFKTEEAYRFYCLGVMNSKDSYLYKTYKDICKEATQTKSLDLSYEYMCWRTKKVVRSLKHQALCTIYAIKIILSKKGPIPINTPNHAKDDVWGLCLTLAYLINKFVAYQNYSLSKPLPSVLKEISQLFQTNLLAVRQERMSSEALSKAFEALLRKLTQAPSAGLSKEEQEKCVQALSKQLDYYKIAIDGFSLKPSESLFCSDKNRALPVVFSHTPLSKGIKDLPSCVKKSFGDQPSTSTDLSQNRNIFFIAQRSEQKIQVGPRLPELDSWGSLSHNGEETPLTKISRSFPTFCIMCSLI